MIMIYRDCLFHPSVCPSVDIPGDFLPFLCLYVAPVWFLGAVVHMFGCSAVVLRNEKRLSFWFLGFFLRVSALPLVLVLGVDYLNPFACLLLHIVPPSPAPSPPSCLSDT